MIMTTGAQAITTLHLVILAVLALIVVAGIIWGGRLRGARRAAIERRKAHQAEIEAAQTVTTAPRQEQALEQAPIVVEPTQMQAQSQVQSSTYADLPSLSTVDDAPLPVSPSGQSPADRPISLLKGLGPKLTTRLAELGIVTVGDIASLDPQSAEALDAQLGVFTGRMTRDRWIEQARLLAAGDRAGFEAAFGKL